ncbi:NYN domain-containing protein [Georgenia wangjunii]|uniref:NYN domain-containing protein n=1 Tax=Georgenia wangjunii TaxID=3117730 RepID=UPI002F26B019
MAKRTAAILIDAGYVWKQVAKAVGKQHRSDVSLNGYGVPLVEALVEEAEGDDMRILRTYWYDGAPDRIPNIQQRAVGRAPRVKLRVGSMSNGRQKGVDRLIQRDILALAQNKAVNDLIILTGDQDMEEELDIAGQHGLLIHVWGVADREQQHQISGRLLRVVDHWKVLPAHWAATFVADETGKSVVDDVPIPVPLTSESQLDAFRHRVLGATVELETANMATEIVPWSSAQLREAGRAAYDALSEQYGAEWTAVRNEVASSTWRTTNGDIVRSIPGRYDTELLDTVEAIVGQPLSDPSQRVHVRNGFWARFDEDNSPAP